MTRNRLAAVVAFVLFLVLTSTGVSNAYWSSHATARASVQAASVASNCTNVATLLNGSFEAPVITESWYRNVPAADVPGWDTTDPVGIEVWKSAGGGGVTTPAGNQFVELNASKAGTLSQSIATAPGQTLSWSLLHRGRAGTDVMEVRLGTSTTTGTLQASLSDGLTWGRHSGTYVVPAGQTTTVLSLTAVSTQDGNISVGNFLDDISVGTGPCLTATTTLTNITSPGTSPRVGDTVEYATTVTNKGGAPSAATRLTGTLPVGLNFQTVQPVGTAEYVASSRTFTARLGLDASATTGGAVAPAERATFTLRAVVATTAAQTTFTYAAGTGIAVTYVDPLAPQWPMTVKPDRVVSTIAAAADLVTTHVVTNASQIPGGSSAPQWTITLRNAGPQSATGAKVRVVLPAGLSSAPVGSSGVTCAAVTGMTRTWDCAAGTMGINTTKSIIVTEPIPSTYTGGTSLAVTATASGTLYDHQPANNSSTGTVTVTHPVNTTSHYQIQTMAATTEKCLDAYWGGTVSGTALAAWVCQTAATEKSQQRWNFTRTADGFYAVKRHGFDIFWQAAPGGVGTSVSLQSRNTTEPLQQWSIQPTSTAGHYQFVNRASGLCLASDAGTAAMATCDAGSPTQRFTIADVGL
jgi:uncharacterized repeat protein (TIGR01451 family)